MIFIGRDIGMLEELYANYFKILHKDFKFVFDFGQYDRENDRAELCIRIIRA